MIIFNEIVYTNIDDLKLAISELPEQEQIYILNDFNGIKNVSVNALESKALFPVLFRSQLAKIGFDSDLVANKIKEIEDSTERQEMIIQWEYNLEFFRYSDFVEKLMTLLNISSRNMDILFNIITNIEE